jgi:Fe-S cluster assembly iron-binding protein IscA
MIHITERAVQLLQHHFKDRIQQPVRLFVKLGACGIRSFGVALEGPTPGDEVFDVEGFQFVVDKRLLKKVTPIKVDADMVGFRISGSGIYPPGGCGSCGFMCGAQGSGRCTGDCGNCTLPCSHGRRFREHLKEKS